MLTILDSMVADKAPGMDGFPLGTLRHSWSFMKEDFLALLNNFRKTANLDWRLNFTLIALNPKKLDS